MNTWERPEFFASDEHRTLEFEGTTLSSRDALTAYLAYFPERAEFSNPKPEAADVAWLDAPPADVAWLAQEELRAEISSAKGRLFRSLRRRCSGPGVGRSGDGQGSLAAPGFGLLAPG